MRQEGERPAQQDVAGAPRVMPVSTYGAIKPKEMAQIYRSNLGVRVGVAVVERMLSGFKPGSASWKYWDEVRQSL